ncbi:MAG: arylamine N-acetyltransferase [Verrucomicrobia bacterium]|nr:arylamine N-acetyltransferase [Verrucomicrobiota bacterium]
MPEVPPAPDLDAYFARIGYTGPRTPDFATLAGIHARHAQTIPFENLDILLGRRIALDLPAIERKLVHDRRGGYCFEQNALLAAVLRALGYTVTPLIGRVRWQVPKDTPTPPVHQLLRVETPDAGSCLADVGFGSMSLFRPLRLEFDTPQSGCLEPRRLVRLAPEEAPAPGGTDLIAHQAKLGDTWGDVYVFRLHPVPPIDFEVSNWFTCAHPQSLFLHTLRASLTLPDRRHTIFNREFTIRHGDGRTEKRTLATADELLAVLAEYFGLHFPPGTRFALRPDVPWPT